MIDNKVAKSGLITIDLKTYLDPAPVAEFDLKDYLYMEYVLREKDFREALGQHDWEQYRNKNLAVFCSTDAIIASWAYMLVATYAAGTARNVWFGNKPDVWLEAYRAGLEKEDWSRFAGKRVLLKGCSDVQMPPGVYLYAANRLLPVVDRLMYGEACSFVPVYRKSKNKTAAAVE
ncbi:MAG: DUF2480 family protein [Balneolaceae bacterium]|nr:MAG: DUF2480 family protein [Balneolaceae bacterium]